MIWMRRLRINSRVYPKRLVLFLPSSVMHLWRITERSKSFSHFVRRLATALLGQLYDAGGTMSMRVVKLYLVAMREVGHGPLLPSKNVFLWALFFGKTSTTKLFN